MSSPSQIPDEAWEHTWATRLIAALSSLTPDPATATFIDNNTEVQFGNYPVVRGLAAITPLIDSVYNLAGTLRKEITRVHIHAPSHTFYIAYTVHITAKADPAAQEILVPTLLVAVKPLGERRESVQRMEVYNDWTPFWGRVGEVGRE